MSKLLFKLAFADFCRPIASRSAVCGRGCGATLVKGAAVWQAGNPARRTNGAISTDRASGGAQRLGR